MRLLLALVSGLTLPGCADEGSPGPNRCDPERRATFDSLPSGPLMETELEGVRIYRTCGDVEVQRAAAQPAAILFIGGCAAFVPDCAADEIEVVFDDSQGALTVALLPSEFGGEPFVSVSTTSLSIVPVDADYDRAVVARGEEDPLVARIDLRGGMGGDGAVSVALREIAFRASADE